MNPNPDPLEQAVDRALKALPPRRAPSSLEARVLAEIARRQALPWWHRSWSYWPTAVRWAFVVLSAAFAAGVLATAFKVFHGITGVAVRTAVAEPVGWWQTAKTAAAAVSHVAGELISLVPTSWLYACAAGVVLAYVLLIGVGATAYRTLWQNR